jgi:hypothetical protein
MITQIDWLAFLTQAQAKREAREKFRSSEFYQCFLANPSAILCVMVFILIICMVTFAPVK